MYQILKIFIPAYLEFMRNLSGFITLLLASTVTTYLLTFYPNDFKHPQLLGYLTHIFMGFAIITFGMNGYNFYSTMEKNLVELEIKHKNKIRISIYLSMLVYAILLLIFLIYVISIRSYKLSIGLE